MTLYYQTRTLKLLIKILNYHFYCVEEFGKPNGKIFLELNRWERERERERERELYETIFQLEPKKNMLEEELKFLISQHNCWNSMSTKRRNNW